MCEAVVSLDGRLDVEDLKVLGAFAGANRDLRRTGTRDRLEAVDDNSAKKARGGRTQGELVIFLRGKGAQLSVDTIQRAERGRATPKTAKIYRKYLSADIMLQGSKKNTPQNRKTAPPHRRQR